MKLTKYARELRRNMTPAERALWQYLRKRQLGVKFRRQAPIGRYIVDFVCFEVKLVIEVDGAHHANNPNDKVRDAWLASQGFRVLRFWNHEVLHNAEGVVSVILGATKHAPNAKRVSARDLTGQTDAPKDVKGYQE